MIVNIYSADRPDVEYVTDSGVVLCGQLRLELSDADRLPPSSGTVDSKAGPNVITVSQDGTVPSISSTQLILEYTQRLVTTGVSRRRSSITQCAARKSRERFYLESPNLLPTPTPIKSVARPDMT